MRLLSLIARLLGMGLDSDREEERDLPLYLTRLEDRQVLNASFALSGATSLNLTNFNNTGGNTTTVTIGQSGNNYTFALNAGTWQGANGGGVTGAGTNTLTVSKAAISGTITLNDSAAGSNVAVQFNAVTLSPLGTLEIQQTGAVTQSGNITANAFSVAGAPASHSIGRETTSWAPSR